ncbi:hypothetical protein GCM10027591_14210 [Zhihengliuella somnathii]
MRPAETSSGRSNTHSAGSSITEHASAVVDAFLGCADVFDPSLAAHGGFRAALVNWFHLIDTQGPESLSKEINRA